MSGRIILQSQFANPNGVMKFLSKQDCIGVFMSLTAEHFCNPGLFEDYVTSGEKI